MERLRVDIETCSPLSAGQTVVDVWKQSTRPKNCDVCMVGRGRRNCGICMVGRGGRNCDVGARWAGEGRWAVHPPQSRNLGGSGGRLMLDSCVHAVMSGSGFHGARPLSGTQLGCLTPPAAWHRLSL